MSSSSPWVAQPRLLLAMCHVDAVGVRLCTVYCVRGGCFVYRVPCTVYSLLCTRWVHHVPCLLHPLHPPCPRLEPAATALAAAAAAAVDGADADWPCLQVHKGTNPVPTTVRALQNSLDPAQSRDESGAFIGRLGKILFRAHQSPVRLDCQPRTPCEARWAFLS